MEPHDRAHGVDPDYERRQHLMVDVISALSINSVDVVQNLLQQPELAKVADNILETHIKRDMTFEMAKAILVYAKPVAADTHYLAYRVWHNVNTKWSDTDRLNFTQLMISHYVRKGSNAALWEYGNASGPTVIATILYTTGEYHHADRRALDWLRKKYQIDPAVAMICKERLGIKDA